MVSRRGAWAIGIAALMACTESNGTVSLGDNEGGVIYPPKPSKDGGLERDGGSTVGPIVTLMSPAPSSDPVLGPVLSGASVDVKCGAAQRDKSAPVDPTKVEIWVYAAGIINPVIKVPAALQGTDLYGASVALDSVPTGAVRFRCRAADKAAISQIGFGEVTTFYDAGPTITFTNLNDTSIIALGTDTANDLTIQFKVEPTRLSATDSEAEVAEVKLSVSGRELTLPVSADGNYQYSLDFSKFFDGVAVDSVTIAVSATDKRSKALATSKKQLVIKIDSEGPTVAFTAPLRVGNAAPIVGGTVTVQMTITDALSGVAEGADKVYAKIQEKIYPITKGANGSYSFTFEARDFEATANITAQVYAFDKAGNTKKESANFAMHLDTVAPWVSLDPETMRECDRNSGKCSAAFDPIGITPIDGSILDKEARFRALVWEKGIHVSGQTEVWLAGVRDETVTFYAQHDRSVPLIIDTNQDGICDSINNGSSLGTRTPPFVQTLGPAQLGGVLPSTTSDELGMAPAVGAGWLPLTDTKPVDKCDGSQMSYVISHTVSKQSTVVYANNTAELCTGGSIDTGSVGGWTCVAVSARDRAGAQGNLGISKPLRVCRALKPGDCDGANATMPPELSCTDGCTIPAEWRINPTGRVIAF